MAKIEKRFLSFGLVLALMVALSSVCFAEEFNFSNLKKSVDSNSWSYIGSATKDSATENGELKITKMYDADGNETSLYSQVYAKATSSGTSTLVTSGSWYDVPIPSSFQAASKSVSLYCKGHIPWIDCKISGYWNVEMSRNVQSGNTQNLKSTVIQRSFPKWSVAERRKTAAASDQAAVCACAHSRYFAGGSPSGLRV